MIVKFPYHILSTPAPSVPEGLYTGDALASRAAVAQSSQRQLGVGAWTWFNIPNVFQLANGNFLIGYVDTSGYSCAVNVGNDTAHVMRLSSFTEVDDHNEPSFARLASGNIIAAWSRHSTDSKVTYRISTTPNPTSLSDWGAIGEYITAAPSNSYANAFYLSQEARLYVFSRALGYDPTVRTSINEGASFQAEKQVLNIGDNTVRPYAVYDSNNLNRIDICYTDGHPRDVTTGLWHGYISGETFYNSAGSLIKAKADWPLQHTSNPAERGTQLYTYSAAAYSGGQTVDDYIPSGRAWCDGIKRYANGHINIAFHVWKGSQSSGTSDYDNDRIYYYIARWNGVSWSKKLVGQGGKGLYAAERHYGGLIALDPVDEHVAYFSSNHANPGDLSIANTAISASGKYELYKVSTSDNGVSYSVSALTANSAYNNLRPRVLRNGSATFLAFFEGDYTTYLNFNTRIRLI